MNTLLKYWKTGKSKQNPLFFYHHNTELSIFWSTFSDAFPLPPTNTKRKAGNLG